MAVVRFSDVPVSTYKYQPIITMKTDIETIGRYDNLRNMPECFHSITPDTLLPRAPWNVNSEIKSFRKVQYNYGSRSYEVTRLEPAILQYGWNGRFEKPTFGSARFEAGTISLCQSTLASYKGKSLSAAFVSAYPNALLDGATVPLGTMRVSEGVVLTNVFETVFHNLGGTKVDLKKGVRRSIAPPSKLVSSISVLFDVPVGTKYEPTTQVKHKVLDAEDAGPEVVHISDIVAIDENFVKDQFSLARALFETFQAYRNDFAAAAQAAGWSGDPVARTPVIIESHHMNPTNENEYFAYTIFQRDLPPSGGHIDKLVVATTNFGLSEEAARGGAATPLFENTKGLLNELSGLVENTHYSTLNDNTRVLLIAGEQKINEFSRAMGV